MKTQLRFTCMMIILILASMVFSNTGFADLKVTDLKTVSLTSSEQADALYENMLSNPYESIYRVEILNKSNSNLDLNAAIDEASRKHRDKPTFFKTGSYLDEYTNQMVYYVGKADFVVADQQAFDAFITEHKQNGVTKITLKLNRYDENQSYPYIENFGFPGHYLVKDEWLHGGDVLRTISRNTSEDAPISKEYLVSSQEEMNSAFLEGVGEFYERFAITVPSNEAYSFDMLTAFRRSAYGSLQMDFVDGIDYTTMGNRFEVSIRYRDDVDTCKTLYSNGVAAVDKIISEIIRPGMDDYTKVLSIHDYIAAQTFYDEYVYAFKLDDPSVSYFTGPLINGRAICGGYASVTRALLDKVGIENRIIEGNASSGVTKDHAWNLLNIDGKYYHLDVTWDDPSHYDPIYGYFLIDDLLMSMDHTWIRENYPICSDGSLEYYKNHGMLMGDKKAFVTYVLAKLKSGQMNFQLRAPSYQDSWMGTDTTTLIYQTFPKWKSFKWFTLKNRDVYSFSFEKIEKLTHTNNGVDYGNGFFVAVGTGGWISKGFGDDVTNWQKQISGVTSELKSVTFGNRRFIAVGANGTILKSVDGIVWKKVNSGVKSILNHVGFEGGRFIAVGASGTILTSLDGDRWTLGASGTKVDLYGTSYAKINGKGQYILVGSNGTILASSNGTTWTKRKSGVSDPLLAVTYGNGMFITGGDSKVILKSTNGITWTKISYGGKRRFSDLVYSSSGFLGVGHDGLYVIDQKSFSSIRYTYDAPLRGIGNSGKQFIFVGQSGGIYKTVK